VEFVNDNYKTSFSVVGRWAYPGYPSTGVLADKLTYRMDQIVRMFAGESGYRSDNPDRLFEMRTSLSDDSSVFEPQITWSVI